MGNLLLHQGNLILASKVHPPSLKPGLVSRPRLNHKLDKILDPQVRLALVLAPPGFGKTSFVYDWSNSHDNEVAWFSIDETENYPVAFWQYFVAALQVIIPQLESPFVKTGTGLSDSDIYNGLVSMINSMAEIKSILVVVLEDLHHITNNAILTRLFFLIENLPTNVKMIITSRQEPDWPLMKLRAKSSLVEIRTCELEFSFSETSELFTKTGLSDFSEDKINSLVKATEGWVFAIHLAAHAAAEDRDFLPDDTKNLLLDGYLESEVFNLLPSNEQEFLMDISILDSLCNSLCQSITGREDAKKSLDLLFQKTLFLLPVEGQRDWVRFHNAFLDLLRSRLSQLPKDRITLLHARACDWYEKNNHITQAVDHALRGEDYERAIALIEKNLFRIMDQSELIHQSELISKLPVDILHSRPELAIANAWLLAYTGSCRKAEHCLADAEDSLAKGSHLSDRRNLEGKILAVQAYISWLRGENDRVIKCASQALIFLNPEDRMNRSVTLISLGTALEDGSQLAEALEVYTEASETCGFEDCTHVHIMACSAKIRLLLILGQLTEAGQLASSTIKQVLEKNPDRADRYAALGNVYANLAEVYRFRNDLTHALETANEGVRLGQQWGQADTTLTTMGIRAAALWSLGEKEEVLTILDDLRLLASQVSPWYLNYLDAYMIMCGVEPERLKNTSKWLDLKNTPAESDFNHHEAMLCRARVRILYTNHKYIEALQWLELTQRDAEKAGTRLAFADSQVVQAICNYGLGNKEKAKKNLAAALDLVKTEQAYSIILDKGEQAVELLQGLTFEAPLDELCSMLLGMAKERLQLNNTGSGKRETSSTQKTSGLSVREREILSFLTTHKTSTEIAEELTVSANTVRFHIKSIYNKLDVHSRDEAVEFARKLGLI